MYLRYSPPLVEVWQQQVYLPMQGIEVGIHHLIARHSHRVAPAIVAQVLAKGHVYVKRNVVYRGFV